MTDRTTRRMTVAVRVVFATALSQLWIFGVGLVPLLLNNLQEVST